MDTRPADRGDLADVVRLYKAFDVATRGFDDTDETDVTGDWDAPGFDLATMTRVLVDGDGAVVGYAVTDAHGDSDTVTDLSLPGDAVEPLLDFLEARGTPLTHYLDSRDEVGGARFTARGWRPARTFWRMRRDHAVPAPEPRWPAGVVVRDMDPDRDGPVVHDIVQTAFEDVGDGHQRKDYEEWAAYLLHPERFLPAFSLLACEGEEVVGVCLGQDMADYGYIRQLAVPAAHRGRGTALALLHESFRRHAAHGLPQTQLGVDAANQTGATRLYERAGMRVSEVFTRWDRPGPPPS